jgi:transcriptional regulator with XRE-family HTH domain
MTTQNMTVSQAIKEYRANHDLNQRDFAKAIGMSASMVSVLESQSQNRITPATYNAILTTGLDLKTVVPSIIIEKVAGKDRNFRPNLNVPLKRKDPVKLLIEARDLVKTANDIINSKVSDFNSEIEEKKKAITEIEGLKKDILSQKEKYLTEIMAIA